MKIGHGFWPGSAIEAGGEGADVSRVPAVPLCCILKGLVMWAEIQKEAKAVCPSAYGPSPYFLEILFHRNHLLGPLTSFNSWDFWQQRNETGQKAFFPWGSSKLQLPPAVPPHQGEPQARS